AILAKWFPKIKLRRHQDALLVTKIKPLVNYLQSYTQPITDEKLKAIKKYLAQEIKLKGSIPITKDSGIFIANK
ncbi:MAG TPA: MerR family transcriptional regulator, partial [Patescibacteria group bacterium]|nr:MerR family transcriptional regulator [Patescibacteria group bacterium]